MATNYILLKPDGLDDSMQAIWRTIQQNHKDFESPYFCPEFTQLMAKVRNDVYVTVIHDGERPVGFFPHQRSAFGKGIPVGGPLSDYHGVIAEPECHWDAKALLKASNLSIWNFDHLIDPSGHFKNDISGQANSYQIDLAAGYQAYVENRRNAGTDYIKKTEGLERKLGRDIGSIEFALHEDKKEVIDCLMDWKSEQCKRTNLPDIFGVTWTKDLITRITSFNANGFSGVCSTLRVNGNLISGHIGMRSRENLHYWFPVYDPRYSKYSPGIILLLKIAESISKVGVTTIDLGKGDAAYKQRLMTGTVSVEEGMATIPSLRGYLEKMRQKAENNIQREGIGRMLSLPFRAIRRFERMRKFQ